MKEISKSLSIHSKINFPHHDKCAACQRVLSVGKVDVKSVRAQGIYAKFDWHALML